MKAVGLRVCVLLMCAMAVSGCRITPAATALPRDLPVGVEDWTVIGHNARWPGAKMAFGPYYTPVVQGSGAASRWAVTGGHLGVGKETRRFGFQLEREATPLLGVGCGSTLWFLRVQSRDGNTHADIGDLRDIPALVCDIWPASATPASTPAGSMTLWYRGRDIVGDLDAPGGRIAIASTRAIADVDIPMGEPVAYRLTREGRLLAHVDLLNAGTVRIVPEVSQQDRDWLAAAATALLMKVD